jgi:Tol biopolymer transport system component
VSVGASGEPAGGSGFFSLSISADGRFVAFLSVADNLAPGDTNGENDVFVRDRRSGTTERVASGVSPSISADGRFVAFTVFETAEHAVVFDRVAAATEVLTVYVNVGRTPLDSGQPAISADGEWLVFVAAGQVFERNRVTGAAALVSVSTSGGPARGRSSSPTISGDGRFVPFASDADNLVPGDTNSANDIFVWDRQTGKTELVSVTADGAPANNSSGSPSISGDGRFVAFTSNATNLVQGDPSGGIFLRDRQVGKTERLTESGGSPSISADGRLVAFVDHSGIIYVRDRQTGKTELVSVSTTIGASGNKPSYFPSISGDGRYVAFWSSASNLVPGGTRGGIYVRDRQTGQTERVGDGFPLAMSSDGRFVAFVSGADDLVPGDTNRVPVIFVRDRRTGKTELVSVSVDGAPANGYSYSPVISADGRFVAFTSAADNLVPGDTNGKLDVFVAERE